MSHRIIVTMRRTMAESTAQLLGAFENEYASSRAEPRHSLRMPTARRPASAPS